MPPLLKESQKDSRGAACLCFTSTSSFSTKGRAGCGSRPCCRSLRTLPGGHLGSVPSQRERPGCCQVSTAWGGARGAGHLGPPLTSTFNPARPGLSLPSVWPRWEVPAPSCPKSAPNYRLHPALHPSIYLSPCLPGTQAGTFSHPRSEGMEGEREGMSVPAPTPSPWLRRC